MASNKKPLVMDFEIVFLEPRKKKFFNKTVQVRRRVHHKKSIGHYIEVGGATIAIERYKIAPTQLRVDLPEEVDSSRFKSDPAFTRTTNKSNT